MASSSSSGDSPASALGVGGSVWFQSGQQMLGGAARIALLAAIRETGSITGAAKAVGMSYKAAWDAVDAMNNLAGEPLVVRATGGKGGGGTALTARARQLIDTFEAIEREHRRFLERAAAALGNLERFDRDWALLGRIGLRTSARNQLYGTVAAVVRGAVNDEISMTLPGGQTVVAVVTCESTETLGLAEGAPVVALVKASALTLVAGDGAGMSAKLSARNQLSGTVSLVRHGAVNAEVMLELPGGTVLTAVVADEDLRAPGFAAGQAATAVFKASSVILGVSG